MDSDQKMMNEEKSLYVGLRVGLDLSRGADAARVENESDRYRLQSRFGGRVISVQGGAQTLPWCCRCEGQAQHRHLQASVRTYVAAAFKLGFMVGLEIETYLLPTYWSQSTISSS